MEFLQLVVKFRSRYPLHSRIVYIWGNTEEAIDWFVGLREKKHLKFLQLDISNYYSSVSLVLLNKALMFARRITKITRKEIEIMHTARRTIIEFDGDHWTRNSGINNFDVTMGSTDSAQITDLVGLYLLDSLAEEFPELRGGLYRDDALFVLNKLSGPGMERKRKEIRNFFSRSGLSITMEDGCRIANFLDVTFELDTDLFRPYHKPNENLNYVHVKSNHPRAITKSIVKNVANRISKLSANMDIFTENAEYYNRALARAGYTQTIEYTPRNNNCQACPGDLITTVGNVEIDGMNPLPADGGSLSGRRDRKTRRRNITWFNPPWGTQIRTPIAKTFFKILDKSFPASHKYHCLFNRSTVKLSYSTTPNLAENIARINNGILRDSTKPAREERNVLLPPVDTQLKIPLTVNLPVTEPKALPTAANSLSGELEKRCNCGNPHESLIAGSCLLPPTDTKLPPTVNLPLDAPKAHPAAAKSISGALEKGCNCRNPLECPLAGSCLQENVVYKCSVVTTVGTKHYIGATAGTFKRRYYSHKHSFANPIRRHCTSLAEYVWRLKEAGMNYRLDWTVINTANPYRGGGFECDLCSTETLEILRSRDPLLNKRNEILISCTHKLSKTFSSWKSNNPRPTDSLIR